MSIKAVITIGDESITLKGQRESDFYELAYRVVILFAKHKGIKIKEKHLLDDTKICAMDGSWSFRGVHIEFTDIEG